MTNEVGRQNPLALGLVLVGAAAMAIATFLPLYESSGPFGRVKDNTLIQHGGWVLIAAAVAVAVFGYRASQGGQYQWIGAAVSCLFAAAVLAFYFMDKGSRTLYPVGADGKLDTSKPEVSSLAIGIYVAGVGVALALIGAIMLRDRQTESAVLGSITKPNSRSAARAGFFPKTEGDETRKPDRGMTRRMTVWLVCAYGIALLLGVFAAWPAEWWPHR